jgi:hypothetical protein
MDLLILHSVRERRVREKRERNALGRKRYEYDEVNSRREGKEKE